MKTGDLKIIRTKPPMIILDSKHVPLSYMTRGGFQIDTSVSLPADNVA